jgi:hypothetical protein
MISRRKQSEPDEKSTPLRELFSKVAGAYPLPP